MKFDFDEYKILNKMDKMKFIVKCEQNIDDIWLLFLIVLFGVVDVEL